MENDLCMRLETVMTLIRASQDVKGEAQAGVYRAARSILGDVTASLDALITASTVVAEAEDDE